MSEAEETRGEPLALSEPNSTNSNPAPVRTNVDFDGDLVLVVGAEVDEVEQEFLVCSTTLRRVSLVWKKMLFGCFMERKPAQGEWVVTLPEDKAAPLLVLLNIIHAWFGAVPRDPSLSQIYEIMVLAHKYDMTRVVRPWAEDWLRAAAVKQDLKKGPDIVKLTHVAWEFGDEQLFHKMANRLAFSCYVDEAGYLTLIKGLRLDEYDHLGPDNLLDCIKDWRSKSIQETLRSVHQVTKSLMDDTQKHHCNDRKGCAYMLLGSLWTGIMKIRGSLLPETEDEILESVTDLVTCVRNALAQVRGFGFTIEGEKFNDSRYVLAAICLSHNSLSSTGVLDQARLKEQRLKLGLPENLDHLRTITANP
ncbi:hypothetical protein B0T10DRAFT_293357 [Thelonectria olida]|uniref:BTB domain-containing protein n=1 Tax=Thelonectria olida TaxID=1576542 RepID=A0A9P8WAC6_9HYPO|nr:hypothetical protein B0T10DRAFT_293357 [Thelonectria olida]